MSTNTFSQKIIFATALEDAIAAAIAAAEAAEAAATAAEAAAAAAEAAAYSAETVAAAAEAFAVAAAAAATAAEAAAAVAEAAAAAAEAIAFSSPPAIYNFFNIVEFSEPNQLPQNAAVYGIREIPNSNYIFTVTGGPPYSPFPYDCSIPPPSFYTLSGLSGYLDKNPSLKIYYADWGDTNILYPYLTVNIDVIYGISFDVYTESNVPLGPFVTTLNQSQLRTYQSQLDIFQRVYAHNLNAYLTYIDNPGTARGPIYYTFSNYDELNNYKAGVALVNRLYRFDIMAIAYNQTFEIDTSVVPYVTIVGPVCPLRWIVPFPL